MSVLLSAKTKLLEESMKIYLYELRQEQLRGNITSPVEFNYRLFEAMQKIYLSLGNPSFKVRLAKYAPISDHYNSMIQEGFNDITLMYKELAELTDYIGVEFKNIEIQRSNTEAKIKSLTNRIATISTKAKESASVQVFKESFVNTEYYDVDIVQDTPAEINKRAGVLTLATNDSQTLDDLTIKIIDTNGLPGNTHQVKVTGNKYKFYGEDGLHINLADTLDGNTDTWFELERFTITDKVKNKAAGLGFDYIEGISWVDSGDLYIEIHLETPTAKPVNWVSLVPFIPPEKGVIAPRIDSLILDDGKGTKTTVTKDQLMDNDTVFLISRQKVKKAILILRQPYSYNVDSGHWTFVDPGEKKGNQFGSVEQSKIPVLGPMPSVENLGVKYNPSTRGVDWPDYDSSTTFDEASIKNNLFSLTTEDLEVYLEAVKAARYCIGLREILLANYRFKDSSTYISKSWAANGPVSEIALEADTQVPDEFDGSAEWINFFISVTDDNKWYQIYPAGTVGTDLKKRFLINSNIPLEARLDNVGYIDLPSSTKNIRLKIELKRPGVTTLADADYYTPLVKSYDLKVVTRSE